MKASFNKILLLVVAVASASCNESFLDRNHPGDLTGDKLYKTVEDFEGALAGCYGSILGPATTNIYLGEIPSDNVYISRFQPSGNWVDMDRLAITAQNGSLNGYWTDNFATVQRVNIFLDELERSGMTETDKNVMAAEARFLRAYAYFNLVRVFGAVPVYDKRMPLQEMYDVPRGSLDAIYQLIIDDLTEAANLDDYRTPDAQAMAGGKASTTAALAMLGKVYLWKKDFPKAEQTLRTVVEESGKGLVDLADLYDADEPFNQEIIFSINYARTSGFNHPLTAASVPYNVDPTDIYPNISGSFGSGMFMIEPYVAAKFEANDKRLTDWTRTVTFEVLGTEDTNIFSLKYVDPLTTFNGLSGANTIILRYADVLLMYAEALNENGKTGDAYPHIDAVRLRAGINELPDGYSKQQMFEALADERQREFLLEGDRWFDLRFRGMDFLEDEMEVFKPNAYLEQNREVVVEDHLILFPLPEEQVLIKPILGQNDGYGS